MNTANFWCEKCGEPLAVCDGSQWCSEARKRSVTNRGARGGIVTINYYTVVDFSNPVAFYPVTEETIVVKGEMK